MPCPHVSSRFVMLLVLWCALSGAARATSITIELPNGAAYAIELRALDAGAGASAQTYVPFSGLGFVLRQFEPKTQWEWDARTGLLRLSVGRDRFSLSSAARADVVINDRRFQVNAPVRFVEGEIWIPLATARLLVHSLAGLKMTEPASLAALTSPTSAPIVQSPEQALGQGVLPQGTPTPAAATPPPATTGTLPTAPPTTATLATTATAQVLPPPDKAAAWRVTLDPVLIEGTGEAAALVVALRPALVQLAERCANILNEEGTMQTGLLTEHDEATSDDAVLEWAARRPADAMVFFRFELSKLRTAPGYTIFYADESVDWLGVERAAAAAPPAGPASRELSYLPYAAGSRQLAERIGAALADVPGFRDRLIIPAPLYLLKRSPARAVLLAVSFPEKSPELARLADAGFRENVARALAGALIAFRRENPAVGGQPSRTESP